MSTIEKSFADSSYFIRKQKKRKKRKKKAGIKEIHFFIKYSENIFADAEGAELQCHNYPNNINVWILLVEHLFF
jgi:hypothetical protein